MRKTARKMDTSRSRPPSFEDQDERIFKSITKMDSALTNMAEVMGVERFWTMLDQAASEVFNHIEKSYEQQDKPTMQRLVDMLEDWSCRFQSSNIILSMVFVGKALLFADTDLQQSSKYIRKAKYIVEDTPNQYFLSRVMMLEGDMYLGQDPKRAATAFIKCVGFCQKNAIFYSGEQNYHILEEMRTCLLVSYYKLAMIERANDNEQQTVIGYLREAYRQANDLFGDESPIARRLEQRCMQESIRSRDEPTGYANEPSNRKLIVYDGKMEVQDSGLRKLSNVCITYDNQTSEMDILVTTDFDGRKEKNQLSFRLALELEQIKRLGTDLKWLQIKDNRITVNDDAIRKMSTHNPIKYLQLAKEIKNRMPKRSIVPITKNDTEEENQVQSEA